MIDNGFMLIDSLKSYLDKLKFKYELSEDNCEIAVSFSGESLPLTVLIKADNIGGRAVVYCEMPFSVVKEKMIELVMASGYINQVLSVGKFCLNTDSGALSYENYEIIKGLSGFNETYAENLLLSAFSAVDRYADKLYAINCGKLSVKDFASKL